MLGIAVMGFRVLNRWAGLLLIVGTLGQVLPGTVIHAISGVAWGVALVWLGFGTVKLAAEAEADTFAA